MVERVFIRQLIASGSVAWAHRSCLENWLQHSGHNHCSTCNTPLTVQRIPRVRFVIYHISLTEQTLYPVKSDF
jgi:hypothetical protein